VKPVYLDYHATTPVDPRVLDAMLPYFTEKFGNAASRQHAWGWEARDAVDAARARVAALINASASEITFTSGASESNNLAIKGVVASRRDSGRHVVTSAVEHKSVLDVCKAFASDGCEVTVVGVRPDGMIDLDALERAVRPGTVLVSVMAANNEIGTIQPLAEMARIAHAGGALFHTDAAQAAGKIPLDVVAADVDLLSLTAHKFYGPKGSGALFIRRRRPRLSIPAQIAGGGQEGGLRSGTLNVPGIVGLGTAAEICRLEMGAEAARLAALRDRLLQQLTARLDGVHVNGTMTPRLPHNLHVSFDGVEGEALLMALGDLAVSTGSACSSGSQAVSHVMEAIGATGDRGRASIRFGLGRATSDDDIAVAVECVTSAVSSLRRRSAPAGAASSAPGR
jgi:cysteine desulfurase